MWFEVQACCPQWGVIWHWVNKKQGFASEWEKKWSKYGFIWFRLCQTSEKIVLYGGILLLAAHEGHVIFVFLEPNFQKKSGFCSIFYWKKCTLFSLVWPDCDCPASGSEKQWNSFIQRWCSNVFSQRVIKCIHFVKCIFVASRIGSMQEWHFSMVSKHHFG